MEKDKKKEDPFNSLKYKFENTKVKIVKSITKLFGIKVFLYRGYSYGQIIDGDSDLIPYVDFVSYIFKRNPWKNK